jgi:hypothetical protein
MIKKAAQHRAPADLLAVLRKRLSGDRSAAARCA